MASRAALMRGEKVCLMGRNGQGKTTLLEALLANAPGCRDQMSRIDSGAVKWGHEAQIGYFAQDHHGSIENGITVCRMAASVGSQGFEGRDSRACSGRCCSAAKKA